MRGFGESCVCGGFVADVRVVADVVGRSRKDDWRVGSDRGLGVGDRRHRIPLDRNGLRRVARLKRCFCDDHRDDVANMKDLIRRDDGIGFPRRFAPVGIPDWSEAGQFTEGLEVACRIDPQYARHRPRLSRVGDDELRVGVGASEEKCAEGAFRRVVRRVSALACDEAHVFDALDRLTDAEFHGLHVAICSRSRASDAVRRRRPAEVAHACAPFSTLLPNVKLDDRSARLGGALLS